MRVAALALTLLPGLGCVNDFPLSPSDCSSGGFVKPSPSLGFDREPLLVTYPKAATDPDRRRGAERTLVYRFDREPSGTTRSLRDVMFLGDRGTAIAVGDAGTIRVRHPLFGWEEENAGTDADLLAVAVAHFEPRPGRLDASYDPVPDVPPPNPDRIVVVGAGGVAIASGTGRVARWRREDTGTAHDLVAVMHAGALTLAVGRGGTLVARPKSGVWRTIETGTTADLAAIGWMDNAITVVGARGTMLRCRVGEGDAEEAFTCTPLSPTTTADLVGLAGNAAVGDASVRGAAGGWAIAAGGEVRPQGREPIELPWKPELRGIRFGGIEGYLVGDDGAIVHVGVHGTYEHAACLL